MDSLQQILTPTPPVSDQLADWLFFYREVFGRSQKVSSSIVPEYRRGFDQVILVLAGLTANELVEASLRFFGKFSSNIRLEISQKLIDEMKTGLKNERRIAGDYAILARTGYEPENSPQTTSTRLIALDGSHHMDIVERLLFGLFILKTKKIHIDTQGGTLCLPTRNSAGEMIAVTHLTLEEKASRLSRRKVCIEKIFINPWQKPKTDEGDLIPNYLRVREIIAKPFALP